MRNFFFWGKKKRHSPQIVKEGMIKTKERVLQIHEGSAK